MPITSTEGGQAFFVAPCQEVYADAPCVFTKCFKGAAPTAQGSGENTAGYPLTFVPGTTPVCMMRHHTWYRCSGEISRFRIVPQVPAKGLIETGLLLAPQNDLEPDWLFSAGETSVSWAYGEALPKFGYTYEIILTQRGETEITACVTAITPTPEY